MPSATASSFPRSLRTPIAAFQQADRVRPGYLTKRGGQISSRPAPSTARCDSVAGTGSLFTWIRTPSRLTAATRHRRHLRNSQKNFRRLSIRERPDRLERETATPGSARFAGRTEQTPCLPELQSQSATRPVVKLSHFPRRVCAVPAMTCDLRSAYGEKFGLEGETATPGSARQRT